jgi:hypothetical protein
MDNFQNELLFAGAVVLGSLFVLWLGFKILFLPLQLSWRFGRTVARQIGPVALTLLLVWTIALEPEPFVYLWGWFLRFGKALLVDAPRQVTPTIPQVLSACSGEPSASCNTNVGVWVLQLWSTISRPVQTFDVPPHIERAALVFALGVTIATVMAQFPWTEERQAGRGSARTIAALAASFLLALYLAIIAIVAIPVFGEKVPDISPYRASLTDQLKQATPPDDMKYPPLTELESERHKLPDIGSLAGNSSFGFLQDVVKPTWTAQLNLWDASAASLHDAAAAFPAAARDAAHTFQSFFQVSDEGHIGELATQRHVTVLANSFNLWIADYHAALDNCTVTLRDGLGKFRTFYATIVSISQTDLGRAGASLPVDQINQALQAFNYPRCTVSNPDIRDYLPPRSGPVETLGPFGAAAAWLLRTESPELALIIGLLGFGFFGALAASFIREFAGTPRNELPAIGFILPALIRGIGAAILVFLLAKGGTAILTRGDASPNAYAIFFACFVAAVFSEDVWSWARSRQRRQFDNDRPPATPLAGSVAEPDPVHNS